MIRSRGVLSLVLLAGCVAVSPRSQSSLVEADEGAESLEDVFQRVQGSVVTILIRQRTGERDTLGRVVSSAGIGAGALISDDGKIMTAAHVVQVADRVTVVFPGGVRRSARVIGSNPMADVALVQLDGAPPRGAVVAKLADSDAQRVGSRVFVVGAPHGVSHTLTVGYLSARRLAPRLMDGPGIEQFQTDAAINRGNSGGPLFNMQGEVIGVVSYIISETGGSEGLGFAITSNIYRELMLERNPFWSGVEHTYLVGRMARMFNIPDGGAGLLILRVAKGSPGERLGLRGGWARAKIEGHSILLGGDIVLEVLGVPITGLESAPLVRERCDELMPDEELSVVVLREGQRIELKKKMSDLQAPLAARSRRAEEETVSNLHEW